VIRLQLCLIDPAEAKGARVATDDIFHLLLKQFPVVDAAQQPSSERIKTPGGNIDDQRGSARGRNVYSIVKEFLNVS
jgi:hypothetical protein